MGGMGGRLERVSTNCEVVMYWFSLYKHHRKNPDDVTVGSSSQFYNGEKERIRAGGKYFSLEMEAIEN